ncbi:MAG: uracil phosphoribosyltransferase [Saprospiraceae bacterium]|nr:uracil phosphoribosyltransferase [Saprospiraceae bacterium]
MLTTLAEKNTIANRFLAELRHVELQKDRLRFRRNLERMGEVLAYEISQTLDYTAREIETPLGIAQVPLPADRVVLATILRAGLPFHQGMLNFFDGAESAFISAYRRQHKDGSFDIQLEYVSCGDLNDSVLILCDPMLATGASVNLTLKHLERFGAPKTIHIAAVIAATAGLEAVQRQHPQAQLWVGAVDEELTGKAYIVPGLGDAGDLAYGDKH